jgi:hypothetical protein
VPVPDENAFPYGRFRSRNIKNDYAAERHVTDKQEDQVNLYIRFIRFEEQVAHVSSIVLSIRNCCTISQTL